MLMMKVANVERLAVEMMTICFMPTPAESKEQREKRENHDACVAYISQEHCQLKKIYYDGHKKRNEMRFPNLYFTVSWGTWLVFNKECSSFHFYPREFVIDCHSLHQLDQDQNL